MKGLAVTIVAVVVASVLAGPHVVKFNVDEKPRQKPGLKAFSFTNCLPTSKEQAVVNYLSFLPDPLVFPGTLNVNFSVTFKEIVDAPLKAVVYIGKKVGSIWVKIPCIGEIGSCSYDDLCELLDQISECPDPFVQAGVPCKCPFKPGTYVLPQTSFDVEAAIFPPGDYHAQANLTVNSQVVGCYNILATFG